MTYIQQDGTSVVMCDGGAKIQEFIEVASHLKIGDIVLAHDYAASKEVFEQEVFGKLWNWCEITDKDVQDASIQCGLVPFMADSFSKGVWLCMKKTDENRESECQ